MSKKSELFFFMKEMKLYPKRHLLMYHAKCDMHDALPASNSLRRDDIIHIPKAQIH